MTITYRPSYASLWNLWVLFLIGALLAVRPGFFAYLLQSHIDMAGAGDYLAPALRCLGTLTSAWMLLSIWYQRIYSHYVLHEDRIVAVHGIFRRRESTAEYLHIRSIELQKSLPGMLLGYGDLLLGTAGTGETNVNMKGIDAPEKIRDRLRELQQAYMAPPAPPESTPPSEQPHATPSLSPQAPSTEAPSTAVSDTPSNVPSTPGMPLELSDSPTTSLPVDADALNAELDRRIQSSQDQHGDDA